MPLSKAVVWLTRRSQPLLDGLALSMQFRVLIEGPALRDTMHGGSPQLQNEPNISDLPLQMIITTGRVVYSLDEDPLV